VFTGEAPQGPISVVALPIQGSFSGLGRADQSVLSSTVRGIGSELDRDCLSPCGCEITSQGYAVTSFTTSAVQDDEGAGDLEGNRGAMHRVAVKANTNRVQGMGYDRQVSSQFEPSCNSEP